MENKMNENENVKCVWCDDYLSTRLHYNIGEKKFCTKGCSYEYQLKELKDRLKASDNNLIEANLFSNARSNELTGLAKYIFVYCSWFVIIHNYTINPTIRIDR